MRHKASCSNCRDLCGDIITIRSIRHDDSFCLYPAGLRFYQDLSICQRFATSRMHRLPSRSSIRRFRVAALLLLAKCLMAPAAAAVLVYAMITHDNRLILMSLGGMLLTVLVAILQWMMAARTHCPLCMTPVLASKRCMKHRNARPFFGSYRLRVSLGVILVNSFRCPYCNEPTALKVRDRRSGGQYRS